MSCAKCELETETGRYFRIYSGRVLEVTQERVGAQIKTTSNIQFAEPEDVFLCDQCLSKWTRRKGIEFTIMLAVILLCFSLIGFIVSIASPISGVGAIVVMSLAILCLFGAFLLIYFNLVRTPKNLAGPLVAFHLNANEEMGNQLALQLRQKALKKQGYQAIFTRSQYLSLIDQGSLTPLALDPPLKTVWKTFPPSIFAKIDEEIFVQRCLQPQFQEEVESRTWNSDPAFLRILDFLNNVNTNNRNYILATRETEKLLSRFSDFDLIYKWRAVGFEGQGNYSLARAVLISGLKKAKRKFILCTVYGEIEWKSGNLKDAIYWWAQALHCQEAAQDKGKDESVYLYLSYVAEGMGFNTLAASFISWVDKIRPGQIRLEAQEAEDLRGLAQKGRIPGMETVLSELVARYLVH